MNLRDERALLVRAQKSADGIGELFDAYYDRIYGYAYRRVGTRDQAEDIAASVFEDALKSIKRLRWQNKPLAAWLYKIASRRVADFHRERRAASEGAFEFLHVTDDGPLGALERADEHAAVHRGLNRLNANDREIIQLVFFDELDRAEIAAMLDCTTNSVYVRLHRALQRMERILNEDKSFA